MAGYQFRGVPDERLGELKAEIEKYKAEIDRHKRHAGTLNKRVSRANKARDEAHERVHDMVAAHDVAIKEQRKLKHALNVMTEAYEIEKEEKEKQKETAIKCQDRVNELLKRLALLRQEMRMNR